MHMPVNFKLRAIQREGEKCARERAPALMRFPQRMRHGQGEDLL